MTQWPVKVRLVFLAVLLWLAVGCAVPHPALERPRTPADASLDKLLGEGRYTSFSLAGSQLGRDYRYPRGLRQVALRYANAGEALEGLRLWEKDLRRTRRATVDGVTTIMGSAYLTYHGDDLQGLAWTSGVWLLIAEAPDADALRRLMDNEGLGGMGLGETSKAVLRYLWSIVPALFVLGLIGTYVMMNLIAGWMIVKPEAGVTPVSRQELVNRLLAINDRKPPFIVASGEKSDLVAEWNLVDATWWEAFQKAGLKKSYRLFLALDESRHEVRAFEQEGSIAWGAGPQAHYSRTWFGGIVLFRKERAVAYGLKSLAPPEVGKIYDYSFDVDEIKGPIIHIVTAAGWRFAPQLWAWKVKRTEHM
jgi:hypothetical protein